MKETKTLNIYIKFAQNVLKIAKRLYKSNGYVKFGFEKEYIECDAKMKPEDIFIRDCLLFK